LDAESLELNTAFYQVEMVAGGKSGWISVLVPSSQRVKPTHCAVWRGREWTRR